MSVRKLVLGLLAVAGVAVACEMLGGDFVTVPIKVSTSNPAGFWRDVGSQLDRVYGPVLKDKEITTVKVPVHLTVLGLSFPAREPAVFMKLCGETFKDAGERLARDASLSLDPGADTGGDLGEPNFGDPFAGGSSDPWAGCIGATAPGGCVAVGEHGQHQCGAAIPELQCPA